MLKLCRETLRVNSADGDQFRAGVKVVTTGKLVRRQ